MPRIALIHALAHSVTPINQAMGSLWPEATCTNLLDDSLSADLANSGRGLDAAMHQRFQDLAAYAVGTGAQGILFTCSAFGPCIEAVAARHANLPVLKPNEAMIEAAVAAGGPIGLIASFRPTLQTMPAEFPEGTVLRTALVEEAMAAMNRGDVAAHDQAVVQAAVRLSSEGCRVIALAQFSMARAAPAVARFCPGVTVLTTPDTAVQKLRRLVAA